MRTSTKVGKVRGGIATLLGVGIIINYFDRVNVAIIWLTNSLVGLAFAAPIAWSIPSLIAPKGTVGSVGGIMNFLGNLAGIVAPIVAGIVADRVGFAPNFLITGGVLVVGIFCFLILLGKIEQIEVPETELINETPEYVNADRRRAS